MSFENWKDNCLLRKKNFKSEFAYYFLITSGTINFGELCSGIRDLAKKIHELSFQSNSLQPNIEAPELKNLLTKIFYFLNFDG